MALPEMETGGGLFQRSLTRRQLGGAILTGATGLLIADHIPRIDEVSADLECFYRRSSEGPSRYGEVEDYRENIIFDNDLKRALLESGSLSDPIPVEELPLADGELFKGILRLDTSKYVILQARGSKTPDRKIQVLGINLNDGSNCVGEDYYHPIPDVPSEKKAYTTFFNRTPGEYLITINDTEHSYDIAPEDLDVRLMEFTTDDPVFQTIIRRVPRVHLRRDNLDNITRNMPVSNPWRVGEFSDGNEYFVEYGQFLLGQEGGRDLCVAGKPQDDEVFAFDMIEINNGHLLEQAGQEGQHHKMMVYPLPHSPFEVTPESPIVDLVIYTKNNIPSRNPDFFTGKMVALFDEFLQMSDSDREERDIILTANAWQERAQKGELIKQRDRVEDFIDEQLDGLDIIGLSD